METPAICDTCLGDNPYLELIREKNGLECKLCTRPFTTFKWTPQKGKKHRHTMICLTCASAKNCCQSCMLDLTYGINLTLRDQVFKMAGVNNFGDPDQEPKNEISKAYVAQQLESSGALKNIEPESAEKAKELLTKVAMAAKTRLNADKAEPDLEISPTVSKQVSKTDFKKLVSQLPFNGNLIDKPADSVRSFFVFGVTQDLPDYLIGETLSSKGGKVESLYINRHARCGFVTFVNRANAEKIAEALCGTERVPAVVVINGVPIRFAWSKFQNLGSSNAEHYMLASVVKKQMSVLAQKASLKSGKRKTIEEGAPRKRMADGNYASTRGNYEM